MKIVIVNQHVSDVIGGSEIQCDLISRELLSRGHEVVYVAPTKSEPQQVVGEYPYSLCSVNYDAKSISLEVLSHQPDIVYWRLNKHGFRHFAKKMYDHAIPLVFAVSHVNDVTPWSAKPAFGVKGRVRMLYWLIKSRYNHGGFKYVDSLTTLNQDLKDKVKVRYQYHVPNAMVEEVEGVVWPRPYCIWISSIKKSKRPEVYVDLAKKLSGLGIDFLMVGPIQDDDYLWLEEKSKLPENFHFLGAMTVKQVNGLLAESLFHVHTCMPEGFGNVFIQAWLQGKASVSFGYDPSGYLASHELGFDANEDFNVFCEKAKLLITDVNLRDQAGSRAKNFAKENFSVAKLGANVERVLLETLERK
ncbi:glycosyltransferase family 4 protein [Halomonas sp. ML-15]|uniref:glycosyltransferase family 4 protein n=1 Tax=Halomonas sp. ML-15 TaxID=2773305 RepID=UPI0017478014|nr:glycosyltransferase family 4 protein [Halomonas sp. ML-15]MBD3896215.1 glycosyltransferase family 4 protein [Halomonas sp. ML-15]